MRVAKINLISISLILFCSVSWAAQDTAPHGPRMTLCMLGDSRIAQGDWAALLPEFHVINAGVGGQKASQIVARAKSDCQHADRIILSAGTNDVLLCCTIPAAKKAIAKLAKQSNVILTSLPRIDGRLWAAKFSAPYFDFQPHIKKMNRWLLNTSRNKHKEFIDFANVMDDCPACFQADGVHFSPEGYKRLAQSVREALPTSSPRSP